jgi:hypothetical protein
MVGDEHVYRTELGEGGIDHLAWGARVCEVRLDMLEPRTATAQSCDHADDPIRLCAPRVLCVVWRPRMDEDARPVDEKTLGDSEANACSAAYAGHDRNAIS